MEFLLTPKTILIVLKDNSKYTDKLVISVNDKVFTEIKKLSCGLTNLSPDHIQ